MDQSDTPEAPGDPQRWRARAALLQIVAEARLAHFATDAAMLLAHDADPTLWVRDGEIRPMTHAESLARFTEDFQGATYQEWDYMETPIVRLSDDARRRPPDASRMGHQSGESAPHPDPPRRERRGAAVRVRRHRCLRDA